MSFGPISASGSRFKTKRLIILNRDTSQKTKKSADRNTFESLTEHHMKNHQVSYQIKSRVKLPTPLNPHRYSCPPVPAGDSAGSESSAATTLPPC